MKSKGSVFLVGAGPGDPELITVKGKRLLEECDALVYDYLVDKRLLEWVRSDCERHYVGKRAGFHALPQDEIEKLLIRLAEEGKRVVRLKGGDPFIFGRGGEEALALKRAGLRYEVVPAVTAALGCAAYSGIPLTHREHSSAVTFISGHERPDKAESDLIDWEAHARTGATLVLYMSMGRLEAICRRLIAAGRAPTTPVCVIQWGTTARQQSLQASLADAADRVAESGLGAPAIVVIGEVARLGDQLGWYEI